MANADTFGKWETVYINGWPVEIKFISRSSINSCSWCVELCMKLKKPLQL